LPEVKLFAPQTLGWLRYCACGHQVEMARAANGPVFVADAEVEQAGR